MRVRVSASVHVALLFLLIPTIGLASGPAVAGPDETATDPAPTGAADTTVDSDQVEDGTRADTPSGRSSGCRGCPRCGGGTQDRGSGGCRRSETRGGNGGGQGRGGGGCRRSATDDESEENTGGGCGKCRQKGRQGAGQGAGRGHGGGKPEAQKAHSLLDAREGIQRRVEQIPGGVRTTTVTEDPETLELLRGHVRDMEAMIGGEGHIRMWDPLYAEIFEHREQIEMTVLEIEGGVEVTETSTDPWVTELIRSHATKIVEFVYRGWDAYHEPTPVPEAKEAAP